MSKELISKKKEEVICNWCKKEIGTNEWACLKCQGYVLAKESMLRFLDNLKDPYPLDVFPEIHEELFEEINQELINKFEFPLDRLSASLMRRARKNLIESLRNKLEGNSP